jgi:hypothetical protein
MADLPLDALAVISGRSADPFHYLGRHVENGQTVVRALLPEAARVAVWQLPPPHDSTPLHALPSLQVTDVSTPPEQLTSSSPWQAAT